MFPFEDAPTEMYHEWKSFAEAIALNIEPPTHGQYGRHIHGNPLRRRSLVSHPTRGQNRPPPALADPDFRLARGH